MASATACDKTTKVTGYHHVCVGTANAKIHFCTRLCADSARPHDTVTTCRTQITEFTVWSLTLQSVPRSFNTLRFCFTDHCMRIFPNGKIFRLFRFFCHTALLQNFCSAPSITHVYFFFCRQADNCWKNIPLWSGVLLIQLFKPRFVYNLKYAALYADKNTGPHHIIQQSGNCLTR